MAADRLSRRDWMVVLVLAVAAVALRLPDIGNPLLDIDEQMYLLVGQRMGDGAIPYVDIWDRKPIGLFLIYAAAQALPGDPVVGSHLLALATVIATALVVAAFARRFANTSGAISAGLLYLAWLELIGGRGGQSPVFYNLPIAAAALLTWDALAGRRRAALPAMLLAGLALQIKPTAVFEGCFFGVVLLLASWHHHRRAARVALDALLYMAVALGPTILAGTAYALIGHFDAWWFANVRSIFLREVTPHAGIAGHLLGAAVLLLVPLVVAVRGIVAQPPAVRAFLAGWLGVALLGWLLVPPYFNHYALPLLVPIAVAGAAALERRPMQLLIGIAAVALLVLSGYPHAGETARTRDRLAALAAIIDRSRGSGCLFVFQAPAALYGATGSCLPTRYPFPSHLVETSEAHAIGTDPAAEVAQILASRPPVIAASTAANDGDPRIIAAVDRALARHYRAVGADLGVTVYVRAD